MVTTGSIFLSYCAIIDAESFGDDANLKRPAIAKKQAWTWHHILYSLAILMNLITMSVYWTLVHEGAVKKWEVTDYGPERVRHLYLEHSIPGAACFVNTCITNCVMKRGIWTFVCKIGCVYGVVQYVFIKCTGIVFYHFMNF